ncbi:MAG: nitroreductase family protein [Pseudolysinimonas sp.]
MEFTDVVRARRMIRTYQPDRPVARDVIDSLLELALKSPSAGHTQGWRFLVLDDITSTTAFWQATVSDPEELADGWLTRLQTAPALIVVLGSERAYRERYAEPDKGSVSPAEQDWPVPDWYIDPGMAALTLLLAAVDAGLGACFFGVPSDRWDALRTAFAIPGDFDPIGVVSLGYPAPDLRSPSLKRGRKRWTDAVGYGSFG